MRDEKMGKKIYIKVYELNKCAVPAVFFQFLFHFKHLSSGTLTALTAEVA